MRRTTNLTTITLMGLALMSPTAAGTAGATCRGEVATVTGADGTDIVGTAGRDVVVTNGSRSVWTSDGDDLVCVTGPDRRRARVVTIDAGAGNDVVDGTATASWPVVGQLGTGQDLFLGGDGPDAVFTGAGERWGPNDTERDVIASGGGADSISSGMAAGGTRFVNPDSVDLGDGDDDLSWTTAGTWVPQAAISGGAGTDTIRADVGAVTYTIDNAAGELRQVAETIVRWEAMEDFDVSAYGSDGTVTLLGGPGPERFTLYGWSTTVTADLGAGDDSLLIDKIPEEGSRLDGGAGHDGLTTGHDEELSWDLAGAAITVGTSRALPATGFEDAQLTAPLVELWGTAGPNRLSFVASEAVLRGRGGDDTLGLGINNLDFGEYYWSFKPRTTDLAGGAGDDRLSTRRQSDDHLSGGAGADVLDSSGGHDRLLGGPGRDLAEAGVGDDTIRGGPGKDLVDGGQGRDGCVAEREQRCEH